MVTSIRYVMCQPLNISNFLCQEIKIKKKVDVKLFFCNMCVTVSHNYRTGLTKIKQKNEFYSREHKLSVQMV